MLSPSICFSRAREGPVLGCTYLLAMSNCGSGKVVRLERNSIWVDCT